MKPWIRCIATACVCTFVFSAGASHATPQFNETFTATTCKDAVNTTADWNTGAGQLRLFPFVPAIVGNCDTPGSAHGVAVAGDLAFMADGANGLQIIDITNPASPAVVGTYNTPGSACGIAVAGDLAFVADELSGLQAVDITNPASPTLVGAYNTPGTAYDVAVAGDLAFVADGGFGLHILNIINPASPTLVGNYNTPGSAWGVAVAGDLTFVADDAAGLQIIDITNPASPALVGTYNTPGNAQGVAVAGDLAFVADGTSGLQVINILNPASPTLVGAYGGGGGYAIGVAVAGDIAFVGRWDAGLQVISIANPAIPTLVGTYNTPGLSWGVAVAGDLAFVGDGSSGLQIADIANWAIPTHVGSYTSGLAYGVAVAGDLAFVGEGTSGLRIINIIDPATPTLVGSYDTPGSAREVAVAGDLAFVADLSSGLQIINIANPASPAIVGTYDTPEWAYGVAVAGDRAFLADQISGLQILNITNPASPTLVAAYNTPGFAYDVALAGDLALVADGTYGLQIIDVTNPASPALVGTYDTPETASGVTVAGDLAFVADGPSGLQIINIANPAVPTLVGSHIVQDWANDVAVAGNLAFVTSATAGLTILDITNPASPALVGSYDTPGQATRLAVAGTRAFVADWNGGLQIIQVFQSEVDAFRDIGQSLAVDATADPIIRARLSTTQTAGVAWEVSATGGAFWQALAPDNVWNALAHPGSDLRWRSVHTWSPGLNPTVSDLHLEWLHDCAVIEAVTDIPNDQGRWVRVSFARSGRDFAEEAPLPITNYGIWRRVDSMAMAAEFAAAPQVAAQTDGAVTKAFGGLPLFTHGGRVFVQSIASDPQTAGLPPGTWELVQNVPALQMDSYLAAIPTQADSTSSGPGYTVLVVTAHTPTPSVWYASAPDSGCSVDNLAPSVPGNFAVAYNTGGGNTLAWDESPDADFQCFRVYRNTSPDFTPSPETLVNSTVANGWVDPEYDGGGVYYKITAMDFSGNESGPASPETVTSAGGPVAPRTFALHPSAPNPFNPVTTIAFSLPQAARVELAVFDMSGRLVRVLVDEVRAAGRYEVSWDGTNYRGRQSASGVYICRMEAGSFRETRRMTLVK